MSNYFYFYFLEIENVLTTEIIIKEEVEDIKEDPLSLPGLKCNFFYRNYK